MTTANYHFYARAHGELHPSFVPARPNPQTPLPPLTLMSGLRFALLLPPPSPTGPGAGAGTVPAPDPPSPELWPASSRRSSGGMVATASMLVPTVSSSAMASLPPQAVVSATPTPRVVGATEKMVRPVQGRGHDQLVGSK